MAAVRPIVLVYQDFATVTTTVTLPDLNVLLVGPAYDVYDYATDKTTIAAGTVGSLTTVPSGTAATGPSLATLAVPEVRAGAVVDGTAANLVAFIDGGYAELTAAANGVLLVDQNTLTGTNFVTAGVKPGDRVTLSDIDTGAGTVTIAKTVLAVTSDTALTFTTNVTLTGTDITGAAYTATGITATGVKYSIQRPVTSTAVTTSSAVAKDVGANTVSSSALKVKIGTVECPVTFGNLYIQYRALRTDLATDLLVINDEADITTNLGKIDERNPLAVGAFVANENSSKSIQVFAVTGDNLNGGTDLLTAHTSARDTLSGRKDIYCIVPLTSDLATVTMWKTHCVAVSDPSISKFRVVIGSSTLPVSQQIFPTTGDSTTGTVEAGGLTILDNSATYLTSGVAVGDVVTVSATKYVVSAVNSENRLTISTTAPTGAIAGYHIQRTLTKDQQVTALSSTTTSLKNSRCTMVWPDSCFVSGVTNAYTGIRSKQPGHFLAAAVGGMVAGLPPHQGFTNIGMAGIDQVFNSNRYFNDTQIDALGSAGWYVIVQDTPTALPYSVHELTTDTTTLESGELMVVKNFDFVSAAYRDAMVGYLGVYNVIPETLDALRASFDSVTSTLLLKRYPKIGAPLLSAKLVSIAALVSQSDRVEMYGTVTIPKPLNEVGLHLTA